MYAYFAHSKSYLFVSPCLKLLEFPVFLRWCNKWIHKQTCQEILHVFYRMPNYTRRRSWRRISSGIDSLFRCVMTRLSLPLKKPLSTKRRWPSPWTPWQVSCIEGLPLDEQILTFPEQVFNMDWLVCVFELYMSEGNIYLKLVQDKTTRKRTCY